MHSEETDINRHSSGLETIVNSADELSGEIKVSSKTLGHISAGLYRSTASAIKELISNAYDADATDVRISMNPPAFDVFSVADNGSGMTLEKFLDLMNSQIGDSDKRRVRTRTQLKNRPLLGRIGIGLLAVSQICHRFEIISHDRESKTGFRANVQLIDYLHERMDSKSSSEEDYDIGRYSAQAVEFDKDRPGTRIVATELRRVFVERFRKDYRPLPDEFDGFFTSVSQCNSTRELGEYWRTVWHIALAAPLPYFDGGPVRGEDIERDRQQELSGFDFRVSVDFLPLRRPVVLPPRKGDQPERDDLSIVKLHIDKQVDGSPLRGEGYIYSQGGKSIYPADLRGLLVRIKNVAIGVYDRNFMDYPMNEGPRIGWISGELNIDEGLEDALNVDRDSFNEIHPHYLEIQRTVHSVMEKEVKRWIFSNASSRRRQKQTLKASAREKTIADLLTGILQKEPRVDRLRLGRIANGQSPIRLDLEAGTVEINSSANWPRSEHERAIAEQVAVAFEAALTSPDLEEARRRFYKLWRQIFS